MRRVRSWRADGTVTTPVEQGPEGEPEGPTAAPAPSPERPPTSAVTVLRSVLATQRWPAIGLAVSSLAAGLAESTILALVAQAATVMVDGGERVSAMVGPFELDQRVPVILGVAAVLGTLRLGLQVVVAYLPSQMAADTQAEMRHRLFDAYSRASWDVQAEEREGHLQELLTNQVGQATLASLQAAMLLSAGLTFLTLVFAAFLLGPFTAVLVLGVAAALAALLRPLARRGRQYASRLSKAQIAYAGTVGTSVRIAEETYTFGTAEAERARLRDGVEVARHHFLRSHFAGRLTQGLYQGLVILLLVGGLAGLYASGTGRIASLGTVVLILVRASSYGQQAQVAWQAMQQAGPYLDRLSDAEERYRANPPALGSQPFPARAALRFDDVSFSYIAERPVLDHISFTAAPGEAVGIVGPSGAGKSTLVQLLLRMRVPTAGRLELGGIPVDDIDLLEWRRNVAYVPQEPRLLHASVTENIRFFRDLPDAAIERAARLAYIHDDIVAMPAGYDTTIGQRADAVSGGQRQRICLARALAGEPEVLVLDEPTSALDATSEAAIQSSLRALRGDLTVFIVAHRPSLLEICDRVVRIEGGRLTVPADAAQELLATGAPPHDGAPPAP